MYVCVIDGQYFVYIRNARNFLCNETDLEFLIDPRRVVA